MKGVHPGIGIEDKMTNDGHNASPSRGSPVRVGPETERWE